MNVKNRIKPPAPAAPTLEDDINSIEGMTDDEIDAELESYGINPKCAVEKVTSSVRDKLNAYSREEGRLHARETVTRHPIHRPHAVNGEE
jgi:hypothetical protein